MGVVSSSRGRGCGTATPDRRILSRRGLSLAAAAAVGLPTAMMAVTGVTTTSAASAPTCATKNFQIRKIGDQGALGTYLVVLAFRNITNRVCTTAGFPGVTIFSHGRGVVVAQRRHAQYSRLQVKPGWRVFDTVSYRHFPTRGQPCSAVTAIGIYAPNSSQSVRIPIRGGSVYCGGALASPLAATIGGTLN